MKTIAFFNNTGRVGKTTLVYHVAWALADRGLRLVAADLDPQAGLTSMFIEEGRLADLWPDAEHPDSILGAVNPILRGLGEPGRPRIEEMGDGLGLLAGDLGLSGFEDTLSRAWLRCADGHQDALRVVSGFHRVLRQAKDDFEADLVLIDVGPNLGAINRAALLAADYVVVPLAPDIFSLQGLRTSGPALREWREAWARWPGKRPPKLDLPSGAMKPVGYVILQHTVRLDRPVRAYARWIERIPSEYWKWVLGKKVKSEIQVEDDRHCLALLKDYRSLMPMAMEARKPIFHLRAADGALGSHAVAARKCGEDFRALSEAITVKCGVTLP